MAVKILALDGLKDAKLCQLLSQMMEMVPGVSSANISYLSQKLTLEIEGRDSAEVVTDVLTLLHRELPEVTIKRTDTGDEEKLSPGHSVYGDDEEAFSFQETMEKLGAALPYGGPGTGVCILGTALAAVCWLFSIVLLPGGLPSWVFSILAWLSAGASILFFHPGPRCDSLKKGSYFVLAAAAVLFFTGLRSDAVLTLLVWQTGVFITVYLYGCFEEEARQVVDTGAPKVSRLRSGMVELVSYTQVLPKDGVIVRDGDTIPFDGTVTGGESDVDESPLTGNEEPLHVSAGDFVRCGSVNHGQLLTIEVTSLREFSAAGIMADLVTKELNETTRTMARIRKWTVRLALASAAGAVLAGVFLAGKGDWLHPVMTLLLVSCPCGASAAAGAIQRGGLGSALRKGAVIRTETALENLAEVRTLIAGYTGVVTEGIYEVEELRTAEWVSEEQLLHTAAFLENRSSHPIAQAIIERYKAETGAEEAPAEGALCESITGYGVRAMIDRQVTLAGSGRFMETAGVEIPENPEGEMRVYVSSGGEYMGMLVLSDPVLDDATQFAKVLKEEYQVKTALITGCDGPVAKAAGTLLGVEEVYPEQTMFGRREIIEQLVQGEEKRRFLAYAGRAADVNSFAGACICIAMGHEGLDTSLETADVIIPSGSPDLITEAVKTSRSTQSNLSFALGVYFAAKIAVFTLAVFYRLPAYLAAAADVLLAIWMAGNALGQIKKGSD